MAVVGEAKIVVRAITTQVKPDIERGLRGLSGTVEKAGRDMGRSFERGFGPDTEAARLKLEALSRAGFVLQGVIGSLGGAISSVVVSLGSLAGAAGGAVASVGALSGVVAALPAGLGAAKLGLSGIGAALGEADQQGSSFGGTIVDVREQLQQLKFDAEQAALSEDQAALNLEKARNNLLRVQDLAPNSMIRRQAELDFAEAELAYRRAKDRNNDLQDELANPDFSSGGGGGAASESAYDKLLPSQKRFVDFLKTLEPLLEDLKSASADSFLPILESQIRRLIDYEPGVGSFFDVLREGIQQSALGLGRATINFTDFLTDAENLNELSTIFRNIRDTLGSFGTVFGNVFDSFLSITEASDSTTRKFLGFLESKTGTFARYLDTEQASGNLEKFFERAGELAADFGEIFGNIGGFINDLIRDSFSQNSGGQIMLDWLKSATQGWQDLRETVGESGFQEYMADTAVNAVAVLQSIGSFIAEFGKLSDMPQIREAARNFQGAADSFGTIIEEAIKVSPIFAEVVDNLLRITAVFADSSAAEMFFEILKTGTEAVAELLENELIADFVNFSGVLFAVALAAGTVFKTVNFFTLALLGFGTTLRTNFIKLQAEMGRTTVAARVLGTAMRGIPFVAFAAAIATGLVFLADGLDKNIINKAPVAKDELTGMFNAGKEGSDILRASLREFDGVFTVGEKAGTSFKTFSTELDGASASGEDFSRVLRAVSDRFPEINSAASTVDIFEKWFGPEQESFAQFEAQLESVGEVLGEQADGNLPAATAAFKDMTNEFGLNREEAAALLDEMPGFTDSLKRQAIEAGLAGTEQQLLNIALQEGGDYYVAAGDAANPYIEILADLEQEAEESARKISELEDALFNFGNGTLDARAAARRTEEDLDRMKEIIEETTGSADGLTGAINDAGTGFDIETEAGREMERQFDRLAESLVGAAEANYELHGSTEEAEEELRDARQTLEDFAIDAGIGEDAAKDLADMIIGSDYDIEMQVKAIEQEQIDKAAKEAQAAIARSNKLYIELLPYSKYANNPDAANEQYGPASENPLGRKDGGFISGLGTGRSDSIPAMLSNGEFVVNSRATRQNRALLEAINSNSNVSMRPSIAVTVNPSQGMDERELADLVSRKIAFDIRRGSI